ncbi:PilW family protein [Kaarinaea lacus]
MMKKTIQNGFSLIELMIGLVIGMIVVAGVTNVYLSTVTSSSTTLKQSKLNQELTSLLSVMSNDIMRAGVWETNDYTAPETNPFSQIDVTALEVMDTMTSNAQVAANSSSGGECIVYAYDADLDNNLDDTDIRGFRLNNGVVQMRYEGDTGVNTRHDSCNDNTNDDWRDVTDGRLIEVTSLNFALNNSRCLNAREPDGVNNDGDADTDEVDEMDCYNAVPSNGSGDVTVETRQIEITIAGRLVTDNSVNATVSQSVRVRNDLVRVR